MVVSEGSTRSPCSSPTRTPIETVFEQRAVSKTVRFGEPRYKSRRCWDCWQPALSGAARQVPENGCAARPHAPLNTEFVRNAAFAVSHVADTRPP